VIWRRRVSGSCVLAAACTISVLAAVPSSEAGEARSVVHIRVRAAIKRLPVAKHSHAGSYDREKDFGDWISQGGGCDTRAVVLKDESLTATTQNINCTVETGKWFSYYNATTYKKASAVQIDHTVPVKNVWISGAWRWTQATRVRYYNDLRDARTLVAVDSFDNESKGDQDPTTWLPSRGKCRYVRHWTAVKTRWHLTVTSAEETKLAQLAEECPNRKLTITKAAIAYRKVHTDAASLQA
jgi:hypothetical protein